MCPAMAYTGNVTAAKYWVFMEKCWLRIGGEKYCEADTWRPFEVVWHEKCIQALFIHTPLLWSLFHHPPGHDALIGISFSVINVKATHWPWYTQLLYVSVLYWCICGTNLLLISAFCLVYFCSDVIFSFSALVQKELRKVSMFVAGKFTQNLDILFW